MTPFEFDSMQHHANMWVNYEGERKYVISVSFPERLFALVDSRGEAELEKWWWVRCENVQLARPELKLINNGS